jgi:AcrR family transcriptional regulator
MSEAVSPLTPKQAEIADAALRIIGSQGIAALTSATLAAELGVSAGAPFRHFASRDEILEGVARRVEEKLRATFPEPTGSPLADIAELFRARAGAVGRQAGIARLMFSDQFTLALPKPAARRLRSLVARTRAFLLESLAAAARAGAIRTDLAPEALLPIVLGTLQSVVLARSLGASREAESARACATLLALLAPLPR